MQYPPEPVLADQSTAEYGVAVAVLEGAGENTGVGEGELTKIYI